MAMQEEIDSQESFVATREPIPPVTPRDRIYGPSEASITLVEYGEFECPHCGRAYFHLKALRERLPELNARFVFRHFARDEVHPFSVRAAIAAEAAGAQGRFWEMHDRLFENPHSLEYEDLREHAASINLDIERFMSDVRDPRYLEAVERHRQGAIESGVTSTPTFFLNERRYEGSYDLDALVSAIRQSDAST
ncbi:MAG: DsbA family protein [Actinomycetota bacterium]|nr:DsbA family protein [Actinomycetota bacterium]